MKFNRLTLISVVLILLLLTNYRSASGDIGPFQGADGSNIAPEGSTQVRMESERVDIFIQPALDEEGRDASFAMVKAHFDMKNLAASEEKMWVEFPLQDAATAAMSGDEIKGFQVEVNEVVVPVRYGSILNDASSGGPEVEMSKAYFEVTFPPYGEYRVDVSYAVQPSIGEENIQIYRYTLSTGSGWSGTIGQADIVVTFPSDIQASSIIEMPQGSRINRQQLLWTKTDFEPAEGDNYMIKVQSPIQGLDASTIPEIPRNAWIEIGSAQLGIENQPEKWESWKYLADSYSVLASVPCSDCNGGEFIDYFTQLGIAAYRKSTELNPNQRAPFIGLAKLMLLEENWSSMPETCDEILSTYEQALRLAPSSDSSSAELENKNLEEIYMSLKAGLPQGTSVPEPGLVPAIGPTATTFNLSVPSAAQLPAATISSTKTPLQSSPAGEKDPVNGWLVGIFGTAVILLLFIVFRFIVHK